MNIVALKRCLYLSLNCRQSFRLLEVKQISSIYSFYSSNSQEDASSSIKTKRRKGRQDHFYFERSKLLNDAQKTSGDLEEKKKYRELYEKIPVVLLLGWAGAQEHHLRKYQEIYSNLGYHTIRFAPSNQLVFLKSGQHINYARRLREILGELELKNNIYITHVFSNASIFILYQHMLAETDWQFFRARQKSAIFDCSPGIPHGPMKIIEGISEVIRPQMPFAPARYLLVGTFITAAMIYHKIKGGQHYYSKSLDVLNADARHVPTLFLYSSADKLVTVDYVREFIERKRKQGVWCDEKLYDDCDHVTIYKKHPDDYKYRVVRHLEHCKVDIKTLVKDIKF